MARIVYPPKPHELALGERSIFLAGSIDMGRAETWQHQVELALGDLPITIFNPRRLAWDASWEQSIDNPLFREQVEWELNGLARAELVAMYFSPASQAPITLLELGLMASSGKVIACCPKGYWRRGNVEIVCQRHGIELVPRLEDLIGAVRRRLGG